MNNYSKKETIIFSTVLVALAIALVFGVRSSRDTGKKNSPTLLANIVNTMPADDISSLPSSTGASTSPSAESSATIAMVPAHPTSSLAKSTKKQPKKIPEVIKPTNSVAAVITPPQAITNMPPTVASSESVQSTPPVFSATLPYSIGIYANNFGQEDHWINWWGGTSKDNGNLIIEATPSSTGGGVLLEGSDAWTDYTFQVTLDWIQGETFSLIARSVSNTNYLECVFDERTPGDLHIRFKQHLGSQVLDLADGHILDYYQTGGINIQAAMQVQDDQGTCGFNNSSISTQVAGQTLSPPLNGKIGIAAWDPIPNNSKIVVKSASVANWMPSLGTNINSRY